MYTTCPGPCPLMSHHMRQIAVASDVQLVSFTVDPEHDSPMVLAAYAKHYPVPAGRWWFLTGPRAELNDLGLNVFHLNSVDGSLIHSTRFALVDGRMRIRATYPTLEDQFRPQLLADIRKLERSNHD
jgi:protein SCO1/2